MLTRCNQCGYENGPNYRFCGMCGAPLENAAPVKSPAPQHAAEAKPAHVSGPSFLGLAEEPDRNLDYLLEDEEDHHSSHWRLYLALVILVVAGLLIWMRWRQEGYPWAALQRAATGVPPPTAGSPAPAASENSPAPPVTPPTPAPEQEKPAPLPTEGTPAAAPQPTTTAANTPPAPAANEPAPATDAPAQPAAAEAPKADAPAAAPAPAPSKPAVQEKPKPTVPATSADDRLAAEGEKYLYGNGVPADCNRAVRNLHTAAAHSNAKAQSLLGAMYATGHCTSRDLPTAYRWFAKALHNDPTNARLESDLQMVWNQMTPGEKSLATRIGQ